MLSFLIALGIVLGSLLLIAIAVAVTFVRFTRLKESSTKFLMRGGQLHKVLFVKGGYRLATKGEDGTVMNVDVEGKVSKQKVRAYDLVVAEANYQPSFWEDRRVPFFKLYWYIRWVETIHRYKWVWTKTTVNDEAKFKVERRFEDDTDHVLVGQEYPYGLEFKGNDIVDKNGVPVEGGATINARVKNPVIVIFDLSQWFETMISIVGPAYRSFVNVRDYKEATSSKREKIDEEVLISLQEKRKRRNDVGDVFTGESAIEELGRKGIELLSVRSRRFSLPKEYQEQVTDQWEAERVAEQRDESGMGALIRMLASATRTETEDLEKAKSRVRQEIAHADAKIRDRYTALLTTSRELLEQQIAAEAPGTSALRRYYFKGGQGGLDLAALLGDVFRGGGHSGGSGGGSEKKDKKGEGGSGSEGPQKGAIETEIEQKVKETERWIKERE